MGNLRWPIYQRKFHPVALTLHLRVRDNRAMIRLAFSLLSISLVGIVPAAVSAADPAAPGGSAVADAVLRCRTIANGTERLACFDAAARAFNGAIATRSVVVVDRAKMEHDQRARFGERRQTAAMATLQDSAGNRLDSITSTLQQASQFGDGSWTFALADGSRWQQTDGLRFAVPPRAGDKAVVKRAALGTYKLSVGRQPAIRVRRRA